MSRTFTVTGDFNTAARAAVAAAALRVREHALRQVTAYTARAEQAKANPESSTEAAHRDGVAYWACTAREYGATEEQITAAEQAAPRLVR
ncbi:hypothetical protein [Rhodococcoides corynebacterioides]|uniref:hypothetical protein n=1 Tax=Rhodococcoides corynebacterioides TaxID=53972 RepID=UPI003AEACAD1